MTAGEWVAGIAIALILLSVIGLVAWPRQIPEHDEHEDASVG